jgi:hypothetical protein
MPSRKLNEIQGEGALRIVPVAGRRLLRSFIELPWSLYASDPCWVPPLIVERKWHLSNKNPYFRHAEFQGWIACRGERVVGRISAQIDQLHLRRHQDATGFFGMLEAEDRAETFHALFASAEAWLRRRGMQRLRGPLNLSINDECGLLVEGYDSPPPIMLGHALPYYALRVEEQGYAGEQDLLAYRLNPACPPLRHLDSLARRVADRVKVRTLRRDQFDEELKILRDIFEDAWSGNWGFIPFTAEEFAEVGKHLKFLVPPELVRIAEIDDEPVAMIVMFPNINEVIRDLNGRLLPFGWLKILWRLKVTGVRSSRVPLMGVRRRYQGSVLGAALAHLLIGPVQAEAGRQGITVVDMSWILEQNKGMRKIIESLGGTQYKRYRIYQKGLHPG